MNKKKKKKNIKKQGPKGLPCPVLMCAGVLRKNQKNKAYVCGKCNTTFKPADEWMAEIKKDPKSASLFRAFLKKFGPKFGVLFTRPPYPMRKLSEIPDFNPPCFPLLFTPEENQALIDGRKTQNQ
ncbi:hypothetical protein KJ969_01540 [Patescibacteria group bacterium]|nr:hypothetical protein [Patescibacteria group bacterium]